MVNHAIVFTLQSNRINKNNSIFLMALLFSNICLALVTTDLECDYKYDTVHIESPFTENSNDRVIWLERPKIKNEIGKFTSNIIINESNNGYLSIQDGLDIISTIQSENKFGSYKKNDFNSINTNASNALQFVMISDTLINDYGRVIKRIEIDKRTKLIERYTKSILSISSKDKNINQRKISEINTSIDIIIFTKYTGVCK